MSNNYEGQNNNNGQPKNGGYQGNQPRNTARPEVVLNETQQKLLVKLASMSYSVSGYVPVESVWKLTPEQIKNVVFRIAKSMLPDIDYVTLETNPKTGAIEAYVWLNNRSRHLRDNTTMNEQSAIHRPITRYSHELKEFMGKFCAKDKARTVGETTNYQVVGIEVLLERFLMIEFDANGEKYANEFGVNGKPQTRLRFGADYNKSNDDKFGKLRYIEITKSTKSEIAQLEPKAKKSYQAR